MLPSAEAKSRSYFSNVSASISHIFRCFSSSIQGFLLNCTVTVIKGISSGLTHWNIQIFRGRPFWVVVSCRSSRPHWRCRLFSPPQSSASLMTTICGSLHSTGRPVSTPTWKVIRFREARTMYAWKRFTWESSVGNSRTHELLFPSDSSGFSHGGFGLSSPPDSVQGSQEQERTILSNRTSGILKHI